jgi:hypothetical protein
MGANVQFIAFREAPDLGRLSAIPGLTGYRLFKHASRPEWYLEGPNPEGKDITFYEPLDYAPEGDAAKHGMAGAKALAAAMKSGGVKPYGLDEKTLAAALTLGIEIGIDALLVYSNDDGIDAGFICESGQVKHAKLPALPKDVAVFENGAARIATPNTGEFDEGEPVLDLHHFANEVANTFFGTSIRWRITSDPYEFRAADYRLLAQSGHRAPFRLPSADTESALGAIDQSQRSPSQQMAAFVALASAHVRAALAPQLIDAPRVDRDLVEWQISQCLLHIRWRAEYADLLAFLEEVLTYLRRLRPKPEFRHQINFEAEGLRLFAAWDALTTKRGV